MTELAVVLPFRNAAGTLGAAVDSVLSQRHVALDLLAVDDGSTDGSAEIAAGLAARHAGLRVIPNAGSGLVDALNTGLRASDCELIARMDADDLCLPGRLSAQYAAMCADPGLAVLGARVAPFPEGSFGGGTNRYIDWQNRLLSPQAHAAALFIESPLCHPSTILRRRSVLGQLGGYRDGPFPEDYDLWLRADAAGLRMAKLPELLLRWRQGPGRATVTDPRYAPARFLALKAPFLAARLSARPGPVTVWGAGKTGKRIAAALEPHGITASRFIDVDPRKLGRTARGAPIVGPDDLRAHPPHWVVVAVGAAGARDQVRTHLAGIGLAEGTDFLCAS